MTRVLAALPLLGVGCVVGGGETYWEFEAPTAVSVMLASGEIDVRSVDDEVARIWWEGGGFGDNARPEVKRSDSGVVFVDADGGLLGGGEVRVGLPAGVGIEAILDRGEVDVGLQAPSDVAACVAAGEVSIGVPAGGYRLDLGVGAGSLTTEIYDDPGAPFEIAACVGAGEVDLYVYDELLDDGFWGDADPEDW